MRRLLFALTLLTVVLGLTACGGDKPHLTAAEQQAQDAVKRRRIPQGIKLTYTEKGPRRAVGEGMPPLRTATAAKTECGYWHAFYVASVYGGPESDHMDGHDYDVTAHAFAIRRAAPGYVPEVQRGCRAGLHR
jgi:hypothetical protein